jgi:hypothetical protein
MRRRAQSGAVVYRGAVVIAQTELSLAGVDGNAHAQRLRQWPRFLRECDLDSAGRGHCIRRAGEHGEAAVALTARTDHVPAVLRHKKFNDFIVAGQRNIHCRRVA